jgi:hypothetical protein
MAIDPPPVLIAKSPWQSVHVPSPGEPVFPAFPVSDKMALVIIVIDAIDNNSAVILLSFMIWFWFYLMVIMVLLFGSKMECN